MTYWLGLICFLLGARFIYSGLQYRQRVIAEHDAKAAAGEPVPALNNEMQIMTSGCAPVFMFGMMLIALVLAALALVIDKRGVLSIFDILGFLFFVAAYLFSMVLRTTATLARIQGSSE